MNPLAGIVLVVASAASFGTLAIFGRYAYADGMDALTILFLRFSLSAVLMAVLLAARRESLPRGLALLQLMGMDAIGDEASLGHPVVRRDLCRCWCYVRPSDAGKRATSAGKRSGMGGNRLDRADRHRAASRDLPGRSGAHRRDECSHALHLGTSGHCFAGCIAFRGDAQADHAAGWRAYPAGSNTGDA